MNEARFAAALPVHKRARRSLEVMVLDAAGHCTHTGSEIRLYAAGSRKLLGIRIVESGSGYCSQNVMPVHLGLADEGPVDVEVTTMTRQGRAVARLPNVDPRADRLIVMKVDADGKLLKQ